MTTILRSFVVLLATALVLDTGPSVAQDQGKTAAAELTSQSQAALTKLEKIKR